MSRITPHQMDLYTSEVVELYRVLEQDIFEMITRRLITSGNIDADTVLQWRFEKMSELRLLNDDTIKALARTTGRAESSIRHAVEDVYDLTIQSVDEEIMGLGMERLPITDQDMRMQGLVNQTFRELDNYVNQSLVTTNFGTGAVTRAYQSIVEETTVKVLSGHQTVNKAITETIIKWRNKGLETGFIDRGGNTWSLQRYADTVIRSTINNTYNQVRTERMDDYNLEFVLVSSLPDAREECSRIQGKVASKNRISSDSRYPSIYDFGYGTPGGLRGVNCRHQFFVFVPGVSENNETQYDEKDAQARAEIVAGQRRLEREIRDAKSNLEIVKIARDDDEILKYQQRVRDKQAKMREYVNAHELPRRREREQIR